MPRERGVAAGAGEPAVADATANPTAQSMARYALGLVLKKVEPDRALALFDEAAELAAAVRNFWWEGIAQDGGGRHPCGARRPDGGRARVP